MGNIKAKPSPKIIGFTEYDRLVCEPIHIRNLKHDIDVFLRNELRMRGTEHMLNNEINTYRARASVLVARVSAISGNPMPQEPPPGYDGGGDLEQFMSYVSEVSFYLSKFLLL
jgi:hypothetical protein